MIYATCHFVSKHAAVCYYSDYGLDQRDIQDKLDEKLIHIGPPKAEEGERIITIDGGTRFAIQTP